MDKFTLTLLGALLALVGAVCLDADGLQRIRRSRVDPLAQIVSGEPGRDPASVALGVALLAASALAGVLASLIP